MSKRKFTLCLPALLHSFHLGYPIYAQSGAVTTGAATVSGRITLNGEPARGVVVVTNCYSISVSCALLLSLLFSSSWFVSLTANAQQSGVITGRVVAEDGAGLSNVIVYLYPINADRRNAGRQLTTTTDEDGNFKFMGVSPRACSIYAQEARGYVNQFIPNSERN